MMLMLVFLLFCLLFLLHSQHSNFLECTKEVPRRFCEDGVCLAIQSPRENEQESWMQSLFFIPS